MKKINMAIYLSTLIASNVFAANIHVPFIHKTVPTEGLTISYNTNSTEKVICITDNFYKGSLSLTENGIEKDAGIAFGNYDGQEFYFTSIGSDKSEITGDLDQFHVDKSGYIKLKDTHYKPHESYVSCFYTPETQIIK